MDMPRLLKNLTIDSVASVDRGAGVGVKVLFVKRDDKQEQEMQTLDGVVEAFAKVSKVDLPHAYSAVLATPEGTAQYRAERDARLLKVGGSALKAPSDPQPEVDLDDTDNLEAEVRAFMQANPSIGSKSRAFDEVVRTPKGRALLRRDRQRQGIAV
jgi:hypothetical protein